MSGSAFAVTHHAFSSGAGRTSDGNGSHASTLKSPSYTKSVSWQHYREKRTVVLTRQFRFPVFTHGHDGYLIEAAAGLLDNASPEARIVIAAGGLVKYTNSKKAK